MLLRTGGQGHPTPIHILASILHTQTYKKVSKTFQLNETRPIDGLTGGLTDRLTDGQSLLKSCVTKTKALQMIFRLIFSIVAVFDRHVTYFRKDITFSTSTIIQDIKKEK